MRVPWKYVPVKTTTDQRRLAVRCSLFAGDRSKAMKNKIRGLCRLMAEWSHLRHSLGENFLRGFCDPCLTAIYGTG